MKKAVVCSRQKNENRWLVHFSDKEDKTIGTISAGCVRKVRKRVLWKSLSMRVRIVLAQWRGLQRQLITGLSLYYHYIITVLTLYCLSLFYHHIITALSLVYHCSITVLSLHYRCTTTVILLYYYYTITVLSLCYLCNISVISLFYHYTVTVLSYCCSILRILLIRYLVEWNCGHSVVVV
jgi:hypothetical protein